VTEYSSLDTELPDAPVPADESPRTGTHHIGPVFQPTHPLALAPVTAPAHSVDGFVRQFLRELNTGQGVALSQSSVNDQYLALARTVRAYLMARWLETTRKQRLSEAKVVGYLSAEYLLGRQLDNALLATDLEEIAAAAMASCGLDLETLRAQELEPGLGNGGLGRLAACFIDSLATMSVPCIGYGIRYEYGIFRQTFVDGRQVEQPDTWLALGSPWEFPHPESAVQVDFGGHTEQYTDTDGVERTRWVPSWNVLAIPYVYTVPGYLNGRVNTLRLWSAQATKAFDLSIFNAGDYAEAVRAQTFAENITKVLYPEDSTPQGKELRLQQQYFFVAASLRDFIDRHLGPEVDLRTLPDRIIFQLNDTHPVIGVPELMRILVDERKFEWEEAWEITKQCFAYTCHTLLPEALEVWPVDMLGRLLPRHLEIIYRINDDFLDEVRAAYPDDEMRARRAIVAGGGRIGARLRRQPIQRRTQAGPAGQHDRRGIACDIAENERHGRSVEIVNSRLGLTLYCSQDRSRKPGSRHVPAFSPTNRVRPLGAVSIIALGLALGMSVSGCNRASMNDVTGSIGGSDSLPATDAALRQRLGDAAWAAAARQYRWSDTARDFLAALRAEPRA